MIDQHNSQMFGTAPIFLQVEIHFVSAKPQLANAFPRPPFCLGNDAAAGCHTSPRRSSRQVLLWTTFREIRAHATEETA